MRSPSSRADKLYLTIGPRGGWGYDGTVVDFAVIEPSAADLDVNSTDDRVDVRPGDWICSTGEVVSGAAGDEPRVHLACRDHGGQRPRRGRRDQRPRGHLHPDDRRCRRLEQPQRRTGRPRHHRRPDDPWRRRRHHHGPGGYGRVRGNHRVLENWNAGTSTAIEDITVANGDPGTGGNIDLGGGVRNNGPAALELRRVTVTGSEAYCNGGGVFNWGNGGNNSLGGTLTIVDSTITGNRANAACSGGSGAGVSSDAGILTITGSTITDNTSGNFGGGVRNATSTVTITDTVITGNSAGKGGGIANDAGPLTVTGSTLSGNTATDQGGGLYNQSATIAVGDTTISSNSAVNGGGVSAGGTATLDNVSATSNTATSLGGGINATGAMTLTGSTVQGTPSPPTPPRAAVFAPTEAT